MEKENKVSWERGLKKKKCVIHKHTSLAVLAALSHVSDEHNN